jgi:hypothetical protein
VLFVLLRPGWDCIEKLFMAEIFRLWIFIKVILQTASYLRNHFNQKGYNYILFALIKKLL